MGLTLITPPTQYPVTLAEAKRQVRVRHDDEDALITSLIAAATAHIESTLDLSLMTQTWALTLDAFSDAIELFRGPVQDIVSVQYSDEDGLTQTVSVDDYTADLLGRRYWVVLNSDTSWPDILDAVNAVTVTYTAGFDELPARYADLKHAILLLVGHWFENRGAGEVGHLVSELPFAVSALLQPHRLVTV